MGLKQVARKFAPVINYLPFNNKFHRRGAKIVFSNTILVGCKIICYGKGNIIRFAGNGGFKNSSIVIYGNNNIVEFSAGVSMDSGSIVLDGDNNNLFVGKDTKFCGKIHIAVIESTTVSIGERGLFSSDITIRTGDSHSVIDLEGNRINPSKDVRIGNHVWVGNQVIITKGATISNNCIVGTGSLVNKIIKQENVILGGVPAHIVKENVNWCSERIAVKD